MKKNSVIIFVLIVLSVLFFYKSYQARTTEKVQEVGSHIPSNALPYDAKEPAYKVIDGVTRKCTPNAYYGASQHIMSPECGPDDIRCAVDLCR